MYHYIVKVPAVSETLVSMDSIVTRIDYFNNKKNYLLFDGGDDTGKRFIMVTEKRITQALQAELKDIFEVAVSYEPVNVNTIDRKRLKKIHIAKKLMLNNDYVHGDQKTLLVTDTVDRLIEKTNKMIGFTKFKTFFKDIAGYIDETAEMGAKCLYNVVLINECGIPLYDHINLLYGMFSASGLLMEHVMITGDRYDARVTEKETGFVYFIEDEWNMEDMGETFRASDEVKLFNRIKRSNNIYITTMTQEEYKKLSVFDLFNSVFPHTVVINELNCEEKIEYICSIADEYGFNVDVKGFTGSRFIESTPVEKLEAAIRRVVTSKLSAKDKDFCINVSDVDFKAKKIKKIPALTELENLVGLTGVKKTVKEIVSFLKKRGKDAVPCLHMVFTGNPGTGKTTVARIIARIFAETGITKEDLLVETDRSGLIGLYVGHTAAKTKRKINKAMGGVLFIDEAYALFTESGIDYGHEAVATLVKAMEDKRDEFVCILAGYTKEMNEMIDMNPGLRDRVQFYIDFPDYDGVELLKIFEMLCKESKYKLGDCAREALSDGLSRLVSAKSKNFSNGRIIRKIFERVRMKQALRAANNMITGKDIMAVFDESEISAMLNTTKRTQIGFSV